MTAENFARLMEKRRARALPSSFAILRDWNRRGGVRVARVAVLDSWPTLDAAGVEELRTGVRHVLPFARLRKAARAAGRVARERIEFQTADEEAQSATTNAAGMASAV